MMRQENPEVMYSTKKESTERLGGHIALVATLLLGTMVVIATGFASLVA